MPMEIEEKLMRCDFCEKTTKFQRNHTKSSGFMLLVHFFLTILTAGVWLVLVSIVKLINEPVEKWRCEECGTLGSRKNRS